MSGEKGQAQISVICPTCHEQIKTIVEFFPGTGQNDGCQCAKCHNHFEVKFQNPDDGHLDLILVKKGLPQPII